MKKIYRGAVVLLILISFCFLTPLVSKAEGMEVSPDKTTVKPGDTITVTVSFSGTDIWFAKVTISCDGAIVQGNGTYLIAAKKRLVIRSLFPRSRREMR